MSAETLLSDDSASRESLIAALRDGEHKLREAVALGNKLFDEREQLNSRVEELMDREATTLISHKREIAVLQSNAAEAARERDSALRQLEEANEEVALLEEQVKRARDDLKAAASTNTLLRDDYQSKERENDVMRRKSVMHETMEEENAKLRIKISEVERLLQQSRAAVSALQSQRSIDEIAWEKQIDAMRQKNSQLASDLETTRRDAAAQIATLRGQRASNSPQSQQSANNDARRGASAPSVPMLQLGLADTEASVEYDAFTARTRGRSMARLAEEDASARLLRRRRGSDLDDEDCSRSMARIVSETPAPPPSGPSDNSGSRATATDQRQSTTVTANGAASSGDGAACPHCGRSATQPQQMQQDSSSDTPPRKRDKGCPCVVM